MPDVGVSTSFEKACIALVCWLMEDANEVIAGACIAISMQTKARRYF